PAAEEDRLDDGENIIGFRRARRGEGRGERGLAPDGGGLRAGRHRRRRALARALPRGFARGLRGRGPAARALGGRADLETAARQGLPRPAQLAAPRLPVARRRGPGLLAVLRLGERGARRAVAALDRGARRARGLAAVARQA